MDVDEVTPWCILGFDSLDRTSEQRIAMLKEMGISQYGFNKGKGHMHEMIEEFKLAADNDIGITSIFLWLNAKRDSVGKLSPSNQELLVPKQLQKNKRCTLFVMSLSSISLTSAQISNTGTYIDILHYNRR